MFCNGTILIASISIILNIQISASSQQLKSENQDKMYTLNGNILEQNDFRQMQYEESFNPGDEYPDEYNKDVNVEEKTSDALNQKSLNEMDFIDSRHISTNDYNDDNYLKDKENSLNRVGDNANQIYDYEIMYLNPSRTSHSNALIYRREVPSNSSLYPSVLTKALEISLNPSVSTNSDGGMLAKVAQKMNTSTLDLAEKLTTSKIGQDNDQFAKLVQNYLASKTAPSSSNSAVKRPLTQNMSKLPEYLETSIEQKSEGNQEYLENDGTVTTSSLTEILNRVLNKLESIHDSKTNDNENHSDGAPCDIVGSWSSNTLGLCFEIQERKDKIHDISPAEINNKILTITVMECIPAKQHQIIDLEWKFTGSALKEWGGPFYVYGQKRRESVAATFLGFCRTCGGVDTIFGSWNFLSPSKDCNDISLAFEIKRDLLRRVRMEIKRKERFKDLLYQSRHGKI